MKKYLAGAVLSLGLLASPAFSQAAALSDVQVQAILAILASFGADTATINSVNAALTGGTPTTSSSSFCYTFNADLTVGSSGAGVSALNQALNLSSVNTSGNTATFDEDTAADVVSFQAKYGIKQTGYVGPLTRAKLNALYGCSTTSTTNVPTQTKSALTSDQIQVLSPSNIIVSAGTKVTISYAVGAKIVAGDPAIIERSIVNATTDVTNSGYIPVSQSAGTYTFDWIPNESGQYQALVKITLGNVTYSARSGMIAVGTPTTTTIAPSVQATPTSGTAPLSVTFSVVNSRGTADNGIAYTITFGDGQSGSFSRSAPFTLSHTYSSGGTYAAALTERTLCSSWECIGSVTTIGSVQITVTAATPTATPNSLPIVSTSAATSITSTTVALNGKVNSAGTLGTTAWFRGSTINPGTCNDAFGVRVPATGGTSFAAGYLSTAFSQTATELTPNATYYYCVIAENQFGKSYGSVTSFTTTAETSGTGGTTSTATPNSLPIVYTDAPTNITSTSVTLNGRVNSAGTTGTTAWFRADTTSPGTCNDNFGTRSSTSGDFSFAAGYLTTPFSLPVTGVIPGTTYYYCAIAQNATGKSYGSVVSYTAPSTSTGTSATAPTATLTQSSASTPSGTAYTLTWDSTNATSCTVSYTGPDGGATISSGSTFGSQTFTTPTAGTFVATNTCTGAGGTDSETVTHTVTAVATPNSLPIVSTTAATNISPTSVVLNGKVNSAGTTGTTGWFRGSATNPGSCNDSFGVRIPAAGGTAFSPGYSSVAFSESVTGLNPGTVYYYCAIASNPFGKSYGNIASFAALLALGPTNTGGLNQTASALNALASATQAASGPTPARFSYTWSRNLQVGSPYAEDVRALQTALVREGVYSGEVSGGFYNQTFIAVKAFQQKHGIEPTGFVGPETRGKLNTLY